jgi:uncharacterized caspase-like protein
MPAEVAFKQYSDTPVPNVPRSRSIVSEIVMAFRIVGLLAAAALLVVTALPESGRAQQPSSQQPSSPQEKRIALVIGNGSYVKAPLATAANDAGLVAQTLQAAGFEVIGARDLDGDTLRGSFRDFIQKAEASGPDTVAMVYLSGYGLQLAGENYFIPVDSKIERDTDIPTEGLRLSDYIRQLAALPLKAGVVVLDIARQQPFIEGNAQIASGLALVDPEPKMLIAYNAAPGTVAPEEQGAYGAYAQALAEMIRAGGLPLPELFDRVRLRVNETTKGAQVPWDAQKVDPSFVFFDRAPDAPPQATPAQAEAARSKPIKDMGAHDAYAAALERDTLQGYEDFLGAYGGDPMAKRVRVIVAARREAITWRRTYRTDTPDAYWSYLRRYPHGPHAADARRRLAILSAALEPPQSFAMIDYDVPPPPPDEIVYVDRPVLMFSDPDFDFAPPPPPPVYYLPPPPEDFIDLPPPYYSDELFILPQPVFIPIPIFVRPPRYVRPPQHNFLFSNIHNRAVIDSQINRRGPGGFNRPGGPMLQPGAKQPTIQRAFNAGPALPGAVSRRATLISEGKAQRPASSFINPRANVGKVDRRAPLPGPRKFGPGATTPQVAPGARTMTPATMPNRNALPVPGRGTVPNAPAARGLQPNPAGPQARPGGPGAPNAGRPGAGGPGHMGQGSGHRGPDGRGRGPDAMKPPPSARPSQPPAAMRPTPQVQRPAAPSRPAPQVRPQVHQPRMAPPPHRAAPPPRVAPPPRMAPQRPPPVARPAARPAPPPRMAPPRAAPPRAAPPRAAPPRAAPPRAAPPRPAPSRPAPKRCPPNAPKC